MTWDAGDRDALVDRLLADPPVVHPMDRSATPAMGVWSTDPGCYRFIAARCGPGTRTLETGTGLSTALFAALGTDHVCVTPGDDEVARLRAYCERAGIATDRVRFAMGGSSTVLPTLDLALDLVLVDGGHGFPTPILDWFYAGGLLVEGGTLVVDDVHLPAVRTLLTFLDRDPRWVPLRSTPKWAAYRRASAGGLIEDWTDQPFYVVHARGARHLVARVAGRVRAALRGSGGA